MSDNKRTAEHVLEDAVDALRKWLERGAYYVPSPGSVLVLLNAVQPAGSQDRAEQPDADKAEVRPSGNGPVPPGEMPPPCERWEDTPKADSSVGAMTREMEARLPVRAYYPSLYEAQQACLEAEARHKGAHRYRPAETKHGWVAELAREEPR